MKTTIDIPDALYRHVKIKAIERGTSVRELMIRGLRRELGEENSPGTGPMLAKEERAVYTTDDLGFVMLKRDAQATAVMDAVIEQLRDREGV